MKTLKELKRLMLESPRRTLAVAESLTCGRVQASVGAISGASDFFLGGVTAYTLEEKVSLLGVRRAAAKRVNCVSAAVAEELARGVCALFGSDVGVATTGYAEPAPSMGVEVPMAWWAIARREGAKFRVVTGRVEVPGASRVKVQQRVAEVVLERLVEELKAGED